jgi:mono/diheme cytochrome c family protein
MRWKPALAAGCALIGVSAVALLWYAHNEHSSDADGTDQALVKLGQAVYAGRCAACHGVSLEGQPNWRERLPNARLPAPPHNAQGHTWHYTDRQLFDITKNGASGVLPGYESDMPGFAGVLSDREIWATLAFIKSTWPPDIRARQARLNREPG